MPGLSWSSPARSDLRRIDTFLAAEASPAVAIRILIAVRDKAELLRRFPQAGPIVPDAGFRPLRVTDTPYLLTYRLLAHGVEILRIHHERQNWREPPP